MDVQISSTMVEGSCNACTNRTDIVYNITFCAMSFRVCEKCREELLEKLKGATWKIKKVGKTKKTKVHVVMTDDCRENDCGCWSESIDSIWLDEKKAEGRAEKRYNGHVIDWEIVDSE